MKRSIQCPNCKEFPRWNWTPLHDGKECGLCRHIRPAKHRIGKKAAQFEATLKALIAEPSNG